MRKFTRLAAALLWATSIGAHAAPVTFDFTGVVNYTYDPLGFDPVIAPGTAFTGSFSFDDAAAPTFVGADFNSYAELLTGFEVDYGGVAFTRAAVPQGPDTTQTGSGRITNNRLHDGADVVYFGSSMQLLPGDPVDGFFRNANLQGASSNPNVFPDAGLPGALNPADFDIVPLTVSVTYARWILSPDQPPVWADYGYISGFLSTIRARPSSVPEPETLPLLAGALLAAHLVRRRRWTPSSRG
jgi:hypothetical protein